MEHDLRKKRLVPGNWMLWLIARTDQGDAVVDLHPIFLGQSRFLMIYLCKLCKITINDKDIEVQCDIC